MRFLFIFLGVVLLQGCVVSPAIQQEKLLFSPYKHVNMEVDPAHPVARTRMQGKVTPLVSIKPGPDAAFLSAVTLAFASGECGQERWGDLDAQAVADANVPAMAASGLRYVISTGGEGNVFTCQSEEGMQKFIRRYQSSTLLGFDFDIESTQTPADIQALVKQVARASRKWPELRFSFTLATFAASDDSGASLNPTGDAVMQALRAERFDGAHINLMVMNYGPASAANCVVRNGRCDMAASAQQAVINLNKRYGTPLDRIGVTAMIGMNDVRDNVFTVEDALALGRYVREQKLGGLHYWSLDRDKPCEGNSVELSPLCSSLNHIPEMAFFQAFTAGLRQARP